MLPKPLRTVAKKINNKRCLRAKAKRLVRVPSLPIALDVETTSLCRLTLSPGGRTALLLIHRRKQMAISGQYGQKARHSDGSLS